MADVDDGYATYYAQRLWALLPAVYRTDDTDPSGALGPLQELLNRVGAQAAVVRRSLDRLWADQSIETCDDWVIPYIGDLLGTNLVNGLDARAQRLDVGKTIYYRRRKGTLAILEELARDVTGWDAHLVEAFRRLARTRHGLDPMVGAAAFPGAGSTEVTALLHGEGLIGALTGTPAGGLADLHSAHGAALTNSPFDELFHTADLRAARGAIGHFGIPKLLVFLWRLTSFTITASTPVSVAGCPGQFVFDPTGREIPLFLPPPPPTRDNWADTWTAAHEWQVPGPLTSGFQAATAIGSDAPPAPPYPDPPPASFAYSVTGGAMYRPTGEAPTLSDGDGTFQPARRVLPDFGVNNRWGVDTPRFLADLTGDGRADIVGFGVDGVWTALSNGDGTFQPARRVLSGFGVNDGWRVDQHPRLLADLSGDGRADIVGFADDGVYTALSNGDGTFQPARRVLSDFGVNNGFGVDNGWRVDRDPRFLADLTGDGKADIVCFGDYGVYTALSNGDGTFQPGQPAHSDFGALNNGWRVDQHPRFLTDLTGDGQADIVGFGDDGTSIALSNGNGTFAPAQLVLTEFGFNQFWRVDQHPRFLADLTGDGKADIVGFFDDGVWTARGNGDGTFQPARRVLSDFGANDGWRVDRHPRLLADLTGDGRVDIVGFGDDGVWTALNNGDGTFQPARRVLSDFGANNGWRVDQHPRFLADLTGDGRADIVGFADDGVWIALNTFTTPGSSATFGRVWPERGRFEVQPSSPPPSDSALTVTYHYGFAADLGAGPYDRLLLGEPPPPGPAPVTAVRGGLLAHPPLDAALAAVAPTGTVMIEDSLTYNRLSDVGTTAAPIESVLVAAAPQKRPVLRPTPESPPGSSPPAWVFTGGGEAQLTLDGLLVCGCDIVLRGSFDTVRITACTLDPGTLYRGAPMSPPPATPLATAVDGQPLRPTTLWIEDDPAAATGSPPGSRPGAIRELRIDHSVVGPIRTRFGGSVETLTITDSIVQAIPATAGPEYSVEDVYDAALLTAALMAADPVSEAVWAALPVTAQAALQAYTAPAPLPQAVIDGLNQVVTGPSLWDPILFQAVALPPDLMTLTGVAASPPSAATHRLNRGLLDAAFPLALALAAVAVSDATVNLSRATVLGALAVHRLAASDCILTGFTNVDDTQDGCIRFSAYVGGSRVPRQYESVTVGAQAALFTSTDYGNPGYGQLLEAADQAITGGPAGATVSAGSDIGSEMGAFCTDLAPIKEQGLLTKYTEYMPLGLTPVIIHVT